MDNMAHQISQNSLTLGHLRRWEAVLAGSTTFPGGSVEWSSGYTLVKRGGVRGQGVAIYDGTVSFELDSMQVRIRVECVDQEHRVAGVELFPRPNARLSGRGVRSASLGRLMERALRALTVAVVSNADGAPLPVGHPGDPDRDLVPADVQAAQRASAGDRRFALLGRVADAYREAMAEGLPTARTVCERVPEVPSEDAARQWVRQARKAGVLLSAPDDRRKGETSA